MVRRGSAGRKGSGKNADDLGEDSLIMSEPKTTEEFQDRGNRKFDVDDPEGAIPDLNKAIEIIPQCAPAYFSETQQCQYSVFGMLQFRHLKLLLCSP